MGPQSGGGRMLEERTKPDCGRGGSGQRGDGHSAPSGVRAGGEGEGGRPGRKAPEGGRGELWPGRAELFPVSTGGEEQGPWGEGDGGGRLCTIGAEGEEEGRGTTEGIKEGGPFGHNEEGTAGMMGQGRTPSGSSVSEGGERDGTASREWSRQDVIVDSWAAGVRRSEAGSTTGEAPKVGS